MPETKKCANPRCPEQLALQAQFCPSCGTPQPPRHGNGGTIRQQNDSLVAAAPWMKITDPPQATIAVYTGVAFLAASALPLLISESLHFSLGGAVWIFALIFVACAVGTYLEYRAAAIIGFCVSVLNAFLVSTN